MVSTCTAACTCTRPDSINRVGSPLKVATRGKGRMRTAPARSARQSCFTSRQAGLRALLALLLTSLTTLPHGALHSPVQQQCELPAVCVDGDCEDGQDGAALQRLVHQVHLPLHHLHLHHLPALALFHHASSLLPMLLADSLKDGSYCTTVPSAGCLQQTSPRQTKL